MDDFAEIIGVTIVSVIVIGLILAAIYLAIVVAGITVSVSATFGGGVSLYNYGLAFRNNVKPEEPKI